MNNQLQTLVPSTLEIVTQDELLAAFADFVRLDVAEGDASPATIRAYHAHVKAFVVWCQRRGVHPGMIGNSDLKEYRAELATQYARDSVALKLASIRRFYTMMHAHGYRADNPAEGLKAPKDKTDRAEKIENKYLTLPEASRVLAIPDTATIQGKRDRAILSLFLHNGPRVSEVAALNVDDMDLERGAIVIQHGKGDKKRTLLIEQNVIADVREWLAARGDVARADNPSLFIALNHDPHERGWRITARAIRQLVDGYLTRANCKRRGVSCHSLRHTFATLALAAGAKLPAIGDALGHSSIETTQVYAKIMNRHAENPARFVAELLGTAVK